MSVLKRHKVSTDDQTSSVLDALGHSTLLNDNKKKRNAALDEWLNRHALLSWPRLLTDDVSQRVTCGVRRLMDTHNRIVFVNGSRIARRGYFEAGSRHRYSTSVTEWVNNELFSAFDDTAVAQRCARSLKYGESVDSPEAIKRAWKIVGRAARDCGVRTHAYVEKRLAMRSGDVDVNRLPLECQLFDSWWTGAQHAHWKALCTEVRLGHREWDLAGTFDALLLDDVGRVVLVDWKVSKKAMNRSGYGRVKNAHLRTVDGLTDSPWWRYAVQLAIYEQLIEKCGDFRVDGGLYVGWLHTNNRTGGVLKNATNVSLRQCVKNLLQDRAKQVARERIQTELGNTVK